MNYIVLDFEWNQTRGREMLLPNGRLLSGEIIEIGAVRLNSRKKMTGSFKYLIRPVFYRRMHSRVKELTGIDNDTLKNGVAFEVAFEKFLDFCGEDFVTITWGPSDITVLKENLEAHGYDKWDVPNYDLQVIYRAQTNAERQSIALNTAAERMGITVPENLHDAQTDALLTAMICEKLNLKKGIKHYSTPLADPMDLDHLAFESVKKIKNTDLVSSDPRVRYIHCPHCRRPIAAQKITTVSKNKKLTTVTCPDHGEFFVNFRLFREPNDTVTVHKFVYEMCPELRTYYDVHIAAADEKRKRHLEKYNEKKRRRSKKKYYKPKNPASSENK